MSDVIGLMRLIYGKKCLRAFRICISVPVAGDRVTGSGVEQLFKINRGAGKSHVIHCQPHFQAGYAVPLIFVFTKFDMLVTSTILREGLADNPELSDEEVWLIGEKSTTKVFDELCIDPLTKAFGEVRVMKVSCA